MTELIIGREASSDAPRLAVTMNGNTDFLGNPGSVPKSISRRHCKITIGDDSLMTVENLTIQPGSTSVPNEVYIDGEDIIKKSVSMTFGRFLAYYADAPEIEKPSSSKERDAVQVYCQKYPQDLGAEPGLSRRSPEKGV